jgi:hypothetical protein
VGRNNVDPRTADYKGNIRQPCEYGYNEDPFMSPPYRRSDSKDVSCGYCAVYALGIQCAYILRTMRSEPSKNDK